MRATVIATVALMAALCLAWQSPGWKAEEKGQATVMPGVTPHILRIVPDTPEAKQIADLMTKNNVSLADAIRTAEKHTNGRAVLAQVSLESPMAPGARERTAGNEQLMFHISCLNDKGDVVMVAIDGRNGQVRQTEPVAALKAGMYEPATALRVLSGYEVMHKDLLNPQDKNIGDIKDIAISDNGRIAYAVVSFTGPLNVGEELFAVPWPALDVRSDNRIVCNVTSKQELETATGFEKERWPATANRYFLRGEEYRLAGHEEPSGQLPTFRYKATDLIGKEVKNTQGQDLGKLTDLAVDANNGRVIFGVLTHGGFLGIGDKLIAIPWPAIEVTERGTLQVDITKDRLASAPNFAKDAWGTTVANPTWAADDYHYFNQTPYWKTGMHERSEMGREPGYNP